MPRRDGAGGNRDGNAARGAPDPYALEDDDEEDENSNPAKPSSKGIGVTVGKRLVLGGSEAKKQTQLPMLFSQEHKKLQAARLVPAGMVNLGNTCYLNSVVQVLMNMATFTGDLRDPSLLSLAQHLPAAGVWAALRATADKLQTATQARPTFESLKPAVEPSELRSAMGRRSSRWRSFSQQDAHEFLVELLEELQSEVLAAEAAAFDRRRMPFSKTRCPTARNLSGSLMHTWTCAACGRCTRAKEPFSCLSLQLPSQGAVNLQDLFSEYLKHHFWRLPRVLVVHIKRFMSVPQQQTQQQQQQALPPAPLRQGTTVGGDAAASGSRAANLLEDEAEGTTAPPANVINVPGTPCREGSAGAGEPAGAAEGAPSAPQPAAAAGGGTRGSTPPAPYLYAKVHTVVKVTAGLDLARHCDAEACAHAHLLEALSLGTLERKTGGDSDEGGAAAGVSPAALSGGRAAPAAGAAAGASGAATVGRAPGAVTGCTLDTAGAGSTCPSPSFMQPNASALQERTVQQQGSALPPRESLRRSIFGGSKAMTPGGLRLRAPDSECGTSALSTGAQADGGDGAPTPYGGCGAGTGAACSLGRQAAQGKGRSQMGAAGGGAAGLTPAQEAQGAGPGGAAARKPEAGHGSTPQALMRSGGKDGGLGKLTCQLTTPMAASLGGGLSSHTGNDRFGPAGPPPGSTGRGGGGGGSAAACSERKAPRPMGTGSFFGTGSATEAVAAEACMSDGQGAPANGVRQANGEALARPFKRMRSTEGSRPATVTAQRLEEMTEEEQFQLALQMSLAEEVAGEAAGSGGSGSGDVGARQGSMARVEHGATATAAITATGAAAGSGPTASRRGAATVLDLSLPTAAATAHPGRVCTSGDSAGGGGGGGGSSRGACRRAKQDVGICEEEGCDNEDSMIELQDESQGCCGASHGGGGDGGQPRDAGRTASAGPALSGASGGKNDGNDTDGSAGLPLPDSSEEGPTPQAKRLERRRARKRRMAKLLDPVDVLDVAESPAVPPQRHQRHRAGSGFGTEGRVHGGLPVAYSVDDDDDGTTALSPVSGGGGGGGKKCLAAGKSGGFGDTSGAGATGKRDEAPADVEMAEEDEELEKAKRLSLATFEAEEEERKFQLHSNDRGTSHGANAAMAHKRSRTEVAWAHMMALPDLPNPGDAGGPAAAVATEPAARDAVLDGGCKTPPRGGVGDGAAAATIGASEAINNPLPPPLRRRSATVSTTAGLGGSEEDGCRSGGIDALMAAAGLETAGHTATGAAAATTARRPASAQRRSSAGATAHDATGTSADQFKFGFALPGSAAVTTGAPVGAALGLAGAGSRREDPLDLTGGDDDDQDLAKAIMLSLQDVHPQNNAIGDAVGDAVPHEVMDLEGMDGVEGNDVEPLPDRPKVLLVPDSDYEEGTDDDDGDEEGKDGGSGNVAAAGSRTAAAGRSRSTVAAMEGVQTTTHESQQQQRRLQSKGDPGQAVASVPLSLMARYRLQGVVRHKGLTPFSGHYVADVLVRSTAGGASGQPTHMWYEHNDAVVSHVDFDRIREDASKQGYLFFFVNASKLAGPVPAAAAVAAAAAKPLPDALAGGAAA
ncbi:hypothetical protein VOLCADRAFT_117002 [Volvox carteri f. nagariensis]|uniref:ubiquitinyl hydrolase 1 n=1 Tax=Volvox carteri f. nagariensis TaxID=3068 RepID=D8TRB9_VOLCA|nr:uncharacterized protein VOLCADRAFT_117002 [Volvox carteri f. nagariensis]EFJ49864.1 hypothetical protein VOLCADRAFT_117002 [Volvox carteri f. nagariensis]|eukprot:XP_002948929.1 hypothetical protein VOLCADRAFT_117002 [Volvox carteri f. nagariensis]